jgi:hypothetical protein
MRTDQNPPNLAGIQLHTRLEVQGSAFPLFSTLHSFLDNDLRYGVDCDRDYPSSRYTEVKLRCNVSVITMFRLPLKFPIQHVPWSGLTSCSGAAGDMSATEWLSHMTAKPASPGRKRPAPFMNVWGLRRELPQNPNQPRASKQPKF